MTWTVALAASATLGLAVYLCVALLFPEKFS
jgi:K+-transporting ATPase KdpF subunit